jgi:hypothetical protein
MLRVLLVEPYYRRGILAARERAETDRELSLPKRSDESLWYPPLGLMKLATFHKNRGDQVHFVHGLGKTLSEEQQELIECNSWDRIYITTLYTFEWKRTIETIHFYKDLAGGDTSKIFVGGIMASLIPERILDETGIRPTIGVLNSPEKVGLDGNVNIDLGLPDYEMLDDCLYAINDTYYAHMTRGCINKCQWCGVPKIEPVYIPYIDIKPMLRELRKRHGDKSRLKLMDNNVLASSFLEKIVGDLIELGYGRNTYTNTKPPKERVVDFNQGLDATFITDETMELLSKLNIKPMRIAFDRISEKDDYIRAVILARKYGVKKFSNYLLYNFKDTPRDLYQRLLVNIRLNEQWRDGKCEPIASIYSFPMRYAPLQSIESPTAICEKDCPQISSGKKSKPKYTLEYGSWTKRAVRSVEVMKGTAHGAISPTPSLARRTIGKSYKEFMINLAMPEEMLRNRNKYERKVYKLEPNREPGTGDIEDFRAFMSRHLRTRDKEFLRFYNVVSQNSRKRVREFLLECNNEEIERWLNLYLK